MARSASVDPIDKFRFRIAVFGDQGPFGPTQELVGAAGFSEIVVPRATIRDINYRENINGPKSMKIAGITTYDPVVLRRGSTVNKALFDWFKNVNNDVADINNFQEALAGLSAVPFQDPFYRKEMIITAIGREGEMLKHWLLFNAWPTVYKGGNDFDAQTSEKLIEELTITYEAMFESIKPTIEEAIQDIEQAAIDALGQAAAAAAIGGLAGAVAGLF